MNTFAPSPHRWSKLALGALAASVVGPFVAMGSLALTYGLGEDDHRLTPRVFLWIFLSGLSLGLGATMFGPVCAALSALHDRRIVRRFGGTVSWMPGLVGVAGWASSLAAAAAFVWAGQVPVRSVVGMLPFAGFVVSPFGIFVQVLSNARARERLPEVAEAQPTFATFDPLRGAALISAALIFVGPPLFYYAGTALHD